MRKIAFFTVALCLSFYSFAQNIYLRYDESCTDRMEYRFVSDASAIEYNTYRIKNTLGDYIFLETGIESPIIQKKAPSKMIDCKNVNLGINDLKDINKGNRKIYLVKQLDSGWALIAVGSASYMSFHNKDLTFITSKYELKANLASNTSRGERVTINYPDEESMSAIFYLGDIPACNDMAYMFKMTPCHICNVDADVTIHPQLGLIREKLLDSDMFELVSVNDIFVCDYLNPSPVALASAEPEQNAQTWSSDASNTEGVAAMETVSADVNTKSIGETALSDCTIKAKENEHIVQQGESLYGIARLYGLSVNALRSWNNITADVVYPCTALSLVAPPLPPSPSMAEIREKDIPTPYVKKTIKPKAQEMESDYEIVVTAKAIKPTKITCKNVANEGEHIVQQGESLNVVAKQYNITVAQLKEWNNLANDIIHPCDKLNVVPTVVQKITPKKIVPKTTIAKTNVAPKVTPKSASTKVAVPKPYSSKAVKKEEAPAATEKALMVKKGSGLYVVKKGETVASLANRFNLGESDFRKINNLSKKESVFAGQVVKTQNCACNIEEELPQTYSEVVVSSKKVKSDIPTSYSTVVLPKPIKVTEDPLDVKVTSKGGEVKKRKYHVVQATETLFTISKLYGTTVEQLKASNGINEDEVIVPNQLLILE